MTDDNIQWTGNETIADNDLVYYRHFSNSAPDIGADEYTETLTGGLQAFWEFEDNAGQAYGTDSEGSYDQLILHP